MTRVPWRVVVPALLALAGASILVLRPTSRSAPPASAARGVTPTGVAAAGDAVAVAAALAATLRAQDVGTVDVADSKVVLLGGDLRLSVETLPRADDHPSLMHAHVRAEAGRIQLQGVEACIVGVGVDKDARIASVASKYLDTAFPPLLSLIRAGAVRGAVVFHGTEPWGIPGRRGFAGPAVGFGPAVDGASLDRAGLMSGVRRLPDDGRAHLLKVTLDGTSGGWSRTVELDGEETVASDNRWAGLPPSTGPALVVRFAVFDRSDALAKSEARADAQRRLGARPTWLFPADACPAAVMPAALLNAAAHGPPGCEGGRLADCLGECERGGALSCYEAAQDIQATDRLDPGAQALHLRACSLGLASACTNAAAGRKPDVAAVDECGFRTFEAVCERASDPWACTMLGMALLDGKPRRRQPARARQVLATACRLGEEDPACATAKGLLARLDARR